MEIKETENNQLQAHILLTNYAQRKILIWGAWENSAYIENLLLSINVDIEGYIDSDTNKQYYKGKPVYQPDILSEGNQKYYICVSLVYHEEVIATLNQYNFREINDYFYFHNRVVLSYSNCYQDVYGNCIKGQINNINVSLEGNNDIFIGNSCSIFENTQIIMKPNAKLHIGNNCKLQKGCRLYIGNNSTLIINSNCSIGVNANISIYNNSSVSIGSYTSTGIDLLLSAEDCTCIEIGSDCMFSDNVKLRSSDGHGIYDINNKTNTSTLKNVRKIVLGNHVWIGMSAILLYNTKVGNGSIIGAGTLTKSSYPNNCVVAGIPAKVIKKNMAWSRKNVDYQEFVNQNQDNPNVYSLTDE